MMVAGIKSDLWVWLRFYEERCWDGGFMADKSYDRRLIGE